MGRQTRPKPGRKGNVMSLPLSKKSLMVLPLLIILLMGFQMFTASPVFADSFQICSYGQSLSSYNNNGCTFNDSQSLNSDDNHWSNLYYHGGSGNLRLRVYVDASVASDVAQQATNAINDWTSSPSDVILDQTSSLSSANIVIYGTDPAYNLNPSQGQAYPYYFDTKSQCLGVGGQTRIGINGNGQVPIYLNYHYWDSAHRTQGNCNIAGWRMTIAHEIGHAMGLNHNNISPKQLMNGCSNTSCSTWVSGPQSIDVYIFNLLYPYRPNCQTGC